MNLTHIKNIIICIFLCISYEIQSSCMYDHSQKMQLIEYVRAQEYIIASKKDFVKDLFDTYFYVEKYVSDYIHTDNGPIIIYTYRTVRRIHTTDANFAEYQKAVHEFDMHVNHVINSIKIMVVSGADLQARDFFGNSVVNYCYTKEIYNALRDLGAPFSLQAWSYFYPELAIISGVATIAALTLGYGIYHRHLNQINYGY